MTTYVHYYILGNATEIFSVRSRSLHRMHGIFEFAFLDQLILGRVALGGRIVNNSRGTPNRQLFVKIAQGYSQHCLRSQRVDIVNGIFVG